MQTSVIISVRSGPGPVLNALESLSRLPEHANLEVVVANCCGPGTERAITENYPGVAVLTLPAETSVAESRNAAIQKSAGAIVVILHERYQVPNNWIQLIWEAHATQTAEVIAGCVGPPSHPTTLQWGMFLTEYWHATPPLPSGALGRPAAGMIPGGNVSYKRAVFQRASMSGYMWELDFHAALFDRGATFYRQGGLLARYGHPPTLAEYIAERWEISREFAVRQAAGMSTILRLAMMASRLLLPFVVVGRICVSVLARNRAYTWLFLQALPWIGVFAVIQACGEMAGFASKRVPAQTVAHNQGVVS